MIIAQLHHQNKETGKCKFVSQKELPDDEIPDRDSGSRVLALWTKDVVQRHPLPDGYQWFLCKEGAPEFVACVTEETV